MNVTKKEAVKHYKNMITYAKKQNPRKYPGKYDMECAIGETGSASHCAYCQKFPRLYCGGCPLLPKAGACCGELWNKMDNAKTWKTWIKYAELVQQYIKDNG